MSKQILTLLVLLFSVSTVSAQTIKDIIINEVLVNNTDSYENEYGERVGWIELKNSGYSNVNIAGCFLRVVKSNGEVISYKVPTNDSRTVIKPQGYVVFFADGTDSRGTFYTNFTLDNTKEISLFGASGRGDAASTIKYGDRELHENISLGYMTTEQGGDTMLKELPATTPGASNETVALKPRSDVFAERDPYGIAMAITAMGIVFMALLVLFLVFKQLGIILVSIVKKKEAVKSPASASTAKVSTIEMMKNEINGEVLAAIAIAIKQNEDDRHDVESEIVTINRTARAYSPWSSKIYGVGNTPKTK